MNIRSLIFGLMCIIALGTSFTSCSKDDDNGLVDEGSKVVLPQTRAFILNAGSSSANNSGIAFYAPNKDGDFVSDIYSTQNGQGLGSLGQDIVAYGNYMYVSVYNSKQLLKLNSAGVEVGRLEITGGGPRNIAAKDGKVYVTTYDGTVLKVDANTMTQEGAVTVGKNPEYITESNGMLYVVNSGWGADSTMSVIDTKDFTLSATVVVQTNPEKVLASEGKIYIQGYGGNYPDYTYPVQEVDVAGGTVKTVGKATNFCEYNGVIYMVYGETDWSTYTTTNTFTSYNAKTGTLTERSFLQNAPEELFSTSIYMMETNPNNGDIYIGTTDYTTNGDVYRFDKNGSFIEKFESGGVNPIHAVFFN